MVAISTPIGRGGIGIVRLSGPDSLSIAQPLLRLRNPLAHAQARFAEILDPDYVTVSGENARPLDEAVVTYFAAPHSYTGEDMVEIRS
jgi:tRNA modification GTPase